jgi:phloretin hydrolase
VSAGSGGEDAGLEEYLARPLTPADPATLAAIEAGPADPADALSLAALDRLLDPAPLAVETGWCRLPNGVRFVSVRTPMPAVSAEMVEWWFDWHARESLRYRIWHPLAHSGNSVEPPRQPGAKPHWGAVHHPVEDVGTGTVHARIAFVPPRQLGFSTDALDDPAVGTIVCGWVGDDRRRLRHSAMAHVFLRENDGLVLRSHFWLGAAIRPYLPVPLADPAAALLNRRAVRDLTLPHGLAPGLARHCAEEYANLAALLPELHARFGPATS